MNKRLDILKEMLLKEPEDAFLNYALALELAKNDDMQKAVSVLEAVLNKDENYLAAYYQLGKFYEQLSEKEKALHFYKKGIEVAKKQKNFKTLGELNEALNQIE